MHKIYLNFSGGNNKLSHVEEEILLKAFSGWLELDSGNEEIIWSLHHHSLMNLAINSLDDDLVFQAASTCITISIEIMVLPENNKDLFIFLSDKLLGSIPKFDKLLK